MKTTGNYSENTIFCFHIGRGGRFYNPGHLTFEGTKKITETTDFENLYPPKFKNGNDDLRTLKAEWLDETGNSVELTNEMVKTGIGRINIDNDYDTTYTTYLKDLTEAEIEAVLEAKPWYLEYIKEALTQLDMIEADKKENKMIEKINNGEYTIETRSDCGCSIDWKLNGEELIPDFCHDACWIGYILVIDGVDVAQHIYGESFEWLVDIDRDADGFEDAEEKIMDEMNFGDFEFDMGTVPEHEEKAKKALIEFLEEKTNEGLKLMRDNERGFSNEYECILVSPESVDEINEDWDELEPEEWASEFLYKGDAATQAYNSFKLI